MIDRLRGWLEDCVWWHLARGHDVHHHYVIHQPIIRFWDHYCETCEMAW